MRETIWTVLLSAGVIHLSGCDRAGDGGKQEPTATPVPTAAASIMPIATETPAPSTTGVEPAVVLAAWKQAMESRDWRSAWSMWGDHGTRSGLSEQAFAARWEPYRTLSVQVGEGHQEGAAGSIFHAVPVTVSGERQDGSAYQLSGTLTLRRANDVPGATPEQLRWHIESSTLTP